MLELVLGSVMDPVMAARVSPKILHEFGSFSGVVYGHPARLLAVEGVTSPLLKHLQLIRASAQRLARAEVVDRPIMSKWSEAVEYIRTRIGHGLVEALHVIYLDRGHRLIKDVTLWEGTPYHTPVYPDQIARRAVEVGASAVIMAHNHPADDCIPSPADIDITIKTINALSALNIEFYDHIIITRSGDYSFRSYGLLPGDPAPPT